MELMILAAILYMGAFPPAAGAVAAAVAIGATAIGAVLGAEYEARRQEPQ